MTSNPLSSLKYLEKMIYSILENNSNLDVNEQLNLQIVGMAITIITNKILPKLLSNNQHYVHTFEELYITLQQFEQTLRNLNELKSDTPVEARR